MSVEESTRRPGPPFDGSAPCAMCPMEVRNLSAVAHNLLSRWDAVLQYGSEESWAKLREKFDALREAEAMIRPLSDAHFADRAHSHGEEATDER